MLEGEYKTQLTKRIYRRFGENNCVVVRMDSALKQGIPDMAILFVGGFWATLEAKTSSNAKRQPNQPYWVARLDVMCFSAFIYPENEEAILNDLQQKYESFWEARIS